MSRKRRIVRKIRSSQCIIIFGAGTIGKKVASWLISEGQTGFLFAVSDKKQNPDSIDGIAVKQIDEMQSVRNIAIVIVAVMPGLHEEMNARLDQFGFGERILVDDKFMRMMGIYEVNGIYPTEKGKYYEWINRITYKGCSFLPCRNVIVFESKIDYTDNCRAMSEYIAENMPGKYKIVWIVSKPQKSDSYFRYIYVSRYRLSVVDIIRLNYYLSRAKYIFFTHPGWFHQWKPEQKVINLGHGNPFKNADKNPLGHVADCVLASGKDGIQYRKKEYKDDIAVEVLGPPRNDWLYRESSDVIKFYTGGRDYRKVIMCLPTYKQYDINLGKIQNIKYDSRETNKFCLSTINSNSELEAFNLFLHKNNVLMICKEHYLQKQIPGRKLSNIRYINDEILQSNNHDIYHLLAAANGLITDYSSIFMDFLLLDRPVGFFFNSVEQYDRGFTMEHPELYMPGMKIYNNQDLEDFVDLVVKGDDGYGEERKAARNLIFDYQDNQNCRRCAEYFKL